MSNFLAGAFDSVAARRARRGAPGAAAALRALRGGVRRRAALPRLRARAAAARVRHARCARCRRGGAVCGHCLAHPPPFDATIAAFAYAFPVDRLIQRVQVPGRLALAEWGARAIRRNRAIGRPRRRLRPTAWSHCRSPRERQRERGYNQAYEIARAVARRDCVSPSGKRWRAARARSAAAGGAAVERAGEERARRVRLRGRSSRAERRGRRRRDDDRRVARRVRANLLQGGRGARRELGRRADAAAGTD